MSEIPEVMRRAGARLEELVAADRVPPEVVAAMQGLALASNDHIAECPRCRAAVNRAGGAVPDRADVCPVLVSLWQGLGRLGALVVNPDTGDLGPLARRVES